MHVVLAMKEMGQVAMVSLKMSLKILTDLNVSAAYLM